ncbi:MAG: 1-acyl-sn-glycerol-3-phosphate acyltransferase [Proteobacteria bacterium]|nr:1-acyl-sn-glycerol-3-phosphate acyltransferase [Pseudomonadota bacterium]
MRQFIGNFAFVIGQVVSTILFSPLALVLSPFLSSLQKAAFIGVWAGFIRWWLKVCCRIDYKVSGLENLPDEPAVVIANHQSAWETIIFQKIFPGQSYLLKRELLWIPFFGWGLAANEPIAIDRAKKTQALQQLITQGKERLKRGRWIVIFPEGTRRPVGQPGTFQAGGAFIASKAGAPIVPVAHNAGVFWSKKSAFNKKPGTVEVVIGPVIESKGRKARELNLQAEEWILHAMQKLAISPE